METTGPALGCFARWKHQIVARDYFLNFEDWWSFYGKL